MTDEGDAFLSAACPLGRDEVEPRERALRLLKELERLLDEGRIARRIDEPIDKAVAQFRWPRSQEYSHRTFHETAARFVQHVCEKGLHPPRRLSFSQAHDEAVALLEQWYEGTRANGYDGAVIDAANPAHDGLRLVLVRLAKALKARERDSYIQWVQARHVRAADWQTRCAVVGILLAHCGRWLPPLLASCPPEQLADCAFDLLLIDRSTDAKLPRS